MQYGMTKKAENFWKGLSHNRAHISPIPPEAYGERFINFMEGITMSREEAERLQQVRAEGGTSQDMARASQAFRRSSVERTIEAAENEAAKSGPEPRARTISTMWDPQDITSPNGPSTLPIVEEAGEAGSTTSGRSPGSRKSPPEQFTSLSEKGPDGVPSSNAKGKEREARSGVAA
jgi:1-phosphatidylinositol-4-phosphate 5-kinase